MESVGSTAASSNASFFIAVQSKHRPGHSAVHGHTASPPLGGAASPKGAPRGHSQRIAHPAGLVELERAHEADAFRAAAAESAFWHAAATDTLAVGGMGAFKKTNRDRNLAKPTVV